MLLSLGLALLVGMLALFSVGLTALQTRVLAAVFFGHTQNIVFSFLAHSFLQLTAAFLSITLFLMVYWLLPNRRLPIASVLPTAIVVGLLWEAAKVVYVHVLRWMDLQAVYGPFAVSVGLMMWAFVTGLSCCSPGRISLQRATPVRCCTRRTSKISGR